MGLNNIVNVAILKSPANWFLVLFSVVLLTTIAHFIFKDGSKHGEA